MKKVDSIDEIKPVDFTGGVRGKHSVSYRRGHTVKIRHDDDTVTVQRFIPDKDAILLDKDVKAFFPNAEAVNNALRTLINIIPTKRKQVPISH
jgi:hypothetical protein